MRKFLLSSLLAAAVAVPAAAQPTPANQPDMTIDQAVRTQVIDATLAAIDKSYVFPDVAQRIAASIRGRSQAGEYNGLASAKDFARTLTEHLQEVSRDKHLRVTYSAQALPPQGAGGPTPEQVAKRAEFLKSMNYGFEKSEKLPGNIGYLDLRSFQATGPEAEAAADAAMSQLADADALIVDLRRNGGGSPHMVAHVSSYLFDKRTHLNSLYWREADRTDEFWTKQDVAGKRFGQDKPIYVLTSKRTFSGAEEFTYNLKNLKRATIIGETTGGGAHPGGVRRVHDNFAVFVPSGRAISPITKTNWEGTGVTPDIEVPADQALDKAKELAAARKK